MFTFIVDGWQLVVLVVFRLAGRVGRILLSGRVGFAECAVDYRKSRVTWFSAVDWHQVTCHVNEK
jgi:hypothetical protein